MIPEYLSLMTVYGYEKMVYYKLTLNDALKEMKKISNEVNEIMNLPSPTMVRLLLNNFHWDANVLTERFYEDSSALFRKLNIVNPFPQTPVNANSQSPLSPSDNPLLHDISQNSDVVLCKTCCDYYPVHETYSLPCRHIFCLNCWGSYLKKKILQDNCGKTLTCPSRCNYLIEDDKVLELIDTDEIRQKFKRLMVETFVENNRKTKFCPGRGCDKIIKVKSSNCGSQLISCADCKTNFCFACTEIWHDPIQCSLLKKWQKKCFDESETCHWLEANTKDCPKCHTAIEKNGGCNHMTCRKAGCNHEFCWLCFGDWKDHANHNCNRFIEDETTKKQENARSELKRYLHYYERYINHFQSAALENKLLEKIQERIEAMQRQKKSYADQQTFLLAYNCLKECRHTLMFTYPFAFYLYPTNQSQVFEDNQSNLETAIEELTGLLEKDLDDVGLIQKVQDKYRFCTSRRKVLLDHTKEGYTEHYWAGLDDY